MFHPNGLVYQVRDKVHGLVPMLVTVDKPQERSSIMQAAERYADLGVDRVAIVSAEWVGDNIVSLTRITDIGMLSNGDTTTSQKAIDIITKEGSLQEFIKSTVNLQ